MAELATHALHIRGPTEPIKVERGSDSHGLVLIDTYIHVTVPLGRSLPACHLAF